MAGSPLQFTIRISHKYGSSELEQGASGSNTSESPIRPKASFSAELLHQILDQINGTLEPDLSTPESLASERTCDLRFTLQSVASPPRTPIQEFGTEGGGSPEPSIELLTTFVESLKGKKATLYASSKRSFAQHLTSYLTAWGMDVSHVSPDGNVDGVTDSPISSPPAKTRMPQVYPANAEGTLGSSVPFNAEAAQPLTESPLFILIDDNIDILKERLQALRIEQNQPSSYRNPRKRPSLAANHRPRSSPHLARLLGQNTTLRQPAPAIIMMFASLSKYKLLKDVMQSIMTSYAASSIPLPEVMIIPKPAGPRRCLTALHTAVTKPTVDSSFIPIATSPTSPGINTRTSFFSSRHNSVSTNPPASPSSSSSTTKSRPVGSRSNSDRSTKSTKDILEQPPNLPPSPLALPDNVEYFSAAAQKLGTSPSSGLVIQSPDGQPAGIYFHPRNKSSRNPSSQSMERDKGQLGVPLPRKASASRLTPNSFGEAVVSFSSLHAATMSPKTTSSESGKGGLPQSISSPNIQTSGREQTPSSSMPSLASSILAPVPRRPSESNRNLSPPPQSPHSEGTPSRRSHNKRPSPQDKDSYNKKGKAPADGNIVPPISVLIVDGVVAFVLFFLSLRALTIFFVDNPINQTILSTFMKKKKITYQLASNGQEAVEKWRTGQFHLILVSHHAIRRTILDLVNQMDIQMPVMDGIQATKEIRRLEKSNAASGYLTNLTPSTETEGQRTPSESSTSATSSESRPPASPYRSSVIIVALTASSLQSDRVAALAAGCNDFLTKPVSLLWLNNKIIEWGSIKALQMWADVRPDAMRSMNTGQAVQARNVAERLNIPKGRATPSPSRLQENAAALALASPAGSSIIPSFAPGGLSGSGTNNSTPTCPANESFRACFDSPVETSLTDLSKVQPFTRRFSDIADRASGLSPPL
jgi:osomolarity two-component system response regulator SSK1